MNSILYTFYFLFTCVAGSNMLFWVSLWQLKEYRWDRFSVHIKDTKQGIRAVFSSNVILPFMGIIFYLMSIFSDTLAKYFSPVSFIIFFILFVLLVKRIVEKKLKRPLFTLKAIGVIIVSSLIIFVLVLLPLTDISLWLLVLLFLIPFIVAVSVFLFAFPTEIYTDIYIQKAKEKRKKFKKLQVIAVSGSYGKSSTKEIIAHILSQKYSVIKTNLSNNTPLVIAKTILTKITENTDFFVVELGAYKKGEVKQLAEMVGPTISVTTAVSDQHLALYGSMQDVIDSEMELLYELPKNSLVLLNGNSQGVILMAKRIKHKNIMWYQTTKNVKKENIAYAQKIIPTTKSVMWEYKEKPYVIAFTSPLLGVHTVENILPAITLALHFDFSPEELQEAVKTLRPMPKTMESVHFIPNIKVIDDTFNASPESVFSSLEYLQLFSKRKLYVLSPLIELGKMGKIRHKEIGQKLADVEFLFVTNKNYLSDIKSGIKEKHGKTQIITGSYKSLAKKISDVLKKGDVIVFEGKEAGIVLRYLL